MKVSNDIRFQCLYDHYKETVFCLRENIKTRDRQIYYVAGVITILLIMTFFPDLFSEFIKSYFKKYLENKLSINNWLLQNLILFILLGILHKYYQITIYIERLYPYIHIIEEKLSKFSKKPDFITRESKSYLQGYPGFSSWTHYLYVWVIPILILLLLLFRMFVIFPENGFLGIGYDLNIIFTSMIFISTILYLAFRVTQTEVKMKENAQ